MLKCDYERHKGITGWRAEKAIEDSVQFLLNNLFLPSIEHGKMVDRKKTHEYGLDDDAINWGDLGVVEVMKSGDRFVVLIEEVAPEATNLRRYVGDWLAEWGWDIEVKTTWYGGSNDFT